MVKMLCPSCGTEGGSGKFCTNCGARMGIGLAKAAAQGEQTHPPLLPNAAFGSLSLYCRFFEDHFTLVRQAYRRSTRQDVPYARLTRVTLCRTGRGAFVSVGWRGAEGGRARLSFADSGEGSAYYCYCFFRLMAPSSARLSIRPAPPSGEVLRRFDAVLAQHDRAGAVAALRSGGMGRKNAVRIVNGYFDLREEALYCRCPERIRQDMMAQGWADAYRLHPTPPRGSSPLFPAPGRKRLSREQWSQIPTGTYYSAYGAIQLTDDRFLILNKFAHKSYVGRFRYDRLSAIHYRRGEGLRPGVLVIRTVNSCCRPIRPGDCFDETTLVFREAENGLFRSIFFLLAALSETFTQCTIQSAGAIEEKIPVAVAADRYFDQCTPDSREAAARLRRDTGLGARAANRLMDGIFERRQAALYAQDPGAACADLKWLAFTKAETEGARRCALEAAGVLHCPRCLSAAVVRARRGYTVQGAYMGPVNRQARTAWRLAMLLSGFAGCWDPVWKCLSCGAKWE